ncbi:MAG: protein kinase, partial [Planctomycetota bacterium JB042]
MTGARWERVASIVERALELPPAEREAFVVRECAGDAALRAEVDALLATEPEAGFMEPPDVEAVLSGAETPGRRIAEFELIRPLGRGGFGTVHLARDTALGRLVAVKVLSAASSFSESDVARFRREARAAARLRHPGIVRVHRADEVDGVHFIAMEHVEGPTLAAALGERGGEGSVLRRDRNGLPAPAAVAELV